jgi:hypothetical protein
MGIVRLSEKQELIVAHVHYTSHVQVLHVLKSRMRTGREESAFLPQDAMISNHMLGTGGVKGRMAMWQR